MREIERERTKAKDLFER